jgi:hypothetical protein
MNQLASEILQSLYVLAQDKSILEENPFHDRRIPSSITVALLCLLAPFGHNLERPRALRMEGGEVVNILHVFRPYIECSQVVESAEQCTQHNIKLATSQILADASTGPTRERYQTLLASTHDCLIWIRPSRGVECIRRWEGILVAMHHPGAHRDGGLLKCIVSSELSRTVGQRGIHQQAQSIH